MKKKLSIFFTAVLISLFSVGIHNADAWDMELTNSSGDLTAGEIYTMDMYFINGLETDNLEVIFTAINYNPELVTFLGVTSESYSRGSGWDEYVLWEGAVFPYTHEEENHFVRDICAAENIYHPDEFFPAVTGETLMASIGFRALETGSFSDIAVFTDTHAAEFVTVDADITDGLINGHTFYEDELIMYTAGTSAFMSPVPIPGAIFLLVPAFLGMIGLRRKKA